MTAEAQVTIDDQFQRLATSRELDLGWKAAMEALDQAENEVIDAACMWLQTHDREEGQPVELIAQAIGFEKSNVLFVLLSSVAGQFTSAAPDPGGFQLDYLPSEKTDEEQGRWRYTYDANRKPIGE